MLADRSCRNPDIPSSAWTVAVGQAVMMSTGDDGLDGGWCQAGGGGTVTILPGRYGGE